MTVDNPPSVNSPRISLRKHKYFWRAGKRIEERNNARSPFPFACRLVVVDGFEHIEARDEPIETVGLAESDPKLRHGCQDERMPFGWRDCAKCGAYIHDQKSELERRCMQADASVID